MKISVVIPTFNGSHKIERLLRLLQKQTRLPDEVIVVIDGSTDGTATLLGNLSINLPFFKVIEQGNTGRAFVRNRGAKEATGDLLVFFDDDMLPEETCIEQHLAHHIMYHYSILTGGIEDKADKQSSDFMQFRSWKSRKWLAPLMENQGNPLSKDKVFLTAANFSISRKLFFQLGGFDQQLKDAEDFDLAVRAYRQDISLYYRHDAFAWHCDPVPAWKYIKRMRQYRQANLLLRERKPEVYEEFPYYEQANISMFKKKGFLFFSTLYWINWVDNGSIKKILPRKIRYKIYDWIITSNGTFFPERVKL